MDKRYCDKEDFLFIGSSDNQCCANCGSSAASLSTKFNYITNNNSSKQDHIVMISIKSAITTIFEHGLALAKTKENKILSWQDSQQLYMCDSCTKLLAQLYSAYVDFMKLTKINSVITRLIKECSLWSFELPDEHVSKEQSHHQEILTVQIKEEPMDHSVEEEEEEQEFILPSSSSLYQNDEKDSSTTYACNDPLSTMSIPNTTTPINTRPNILRKVQTPTTRQEVPRLIDKLPIPRINTYNNRSSNSSQGQETQGHVGGVKRIKDWTPCIVPGCGNKSSDKSLSFHRIPTDASRRLQWVQRLGLDPGKLIQTAKVCSLHFSNGSYANKYHLTLKKDALPKTWIPQHSQKGKVVPSPPTKTTAKKSVGVGDFSSTVLRGTAHMEVNQTSSSALPITIAPNPHLANNTPILLCTSPLTTTSTPTSASILPIPMSSFPLISSSTGCTAVILPPPPPSFSNISNIRSQLVQPPSTIKSKAKLGRKPLPPDVLKTKLRDERLKTRYLEKKLKRYTKDEPPLELEWTTDFTPRK